MKYNSSYLKNIITVIGLSASLAACADDIKTATPRGEKPIVDKTAAINKATSDLQKASTLQEASAAFTALVSLIGRPSSLKLLEGEIDSSVKTQTENQSYLDGIGEEPALNKEQVQRVLAFLGAHIPSLQNLNDSQPEVIAARKGEAAAKQTAAAPAANEPHLIPAPAVPGTAGDQSYTVDSAKKDLRAANTLAEFETVKGKMLGAGMTAKNALILLSDEERFAQTGLNGWNLVKPVSDTQVWNASVDEAIRNSQTRIANIKTVEGELQMGMKIVASAAASITRVGNYFLVIPNGLK